MSAYQLRQFIIKLREKLYPLAIELMASKIAEKCAVHLDDVVTGRIEQKHYVHRFKDSYFRESYSDKELTETGVKTIIERYLISNVRDEVENKFKQISKTHHRNPSYDFQCEISFSPEKDKTFVLIYTEKSEYEKVFEKMKGVKSYPYWNHSDPPKGISYKAWDKRGKEWDNALKDSAPCNYGLTWQLLNSTYPPFYTIELKDILDSAPTIEWRSNRIANEKIMSLKMKEYQEKNNITEEQKKDSLIHAGYFESEKYLRSEEGKKHLNELADEISKTLPPITEEVIKMNYIQLNELKK